MKHITLFAFILTALLAAAPLSQAQAPSSNNASAIPFVPLDTPADKVSPPPAEYPSGKAVQAMTIVNAGQDKALRSLKAALIRANARADTAETVIQGLLGANRLKVQISDLDHVKKRLSNDLDDEKKRTAKLATALKVKEHQIRELEAWEERLREFGRGIPLIMGLLFFSNLVFAALLIGRSFISSKRIRRLENDLGENQATLKEQARMAGERFDTINAMKLAESAAAVQRKVDLRRQLESVRLEVGKEVDRLAARNARLRRMLDMANARLSFYDDNVHDRDIGEESGEIEVRRSGEAADENSAETPPRPVKD